MEQVHDGQDVPENRIVLTHWEPVAYDLLPPERIALPILDLIAAVLTYTRVYLKDTDLILNDRIQQTFRRDKNQWMIFEQLLKRGLVQVLVRPLDGDIPSHLNPHLQPLTARAYAIRTLGGDDFDPEKGHTLWFTGAIDQAMVSGLNTPVSVEAFPQGSNPFLVWLRLALSDWERVVTVPDFSDITKDLAAKLLDLSSDQSAWTRYLENHRLLKPGDSDGKFYRSQVYRILKCEPEPNVGARKLTQAIYNTVYCHWQNAAGVYTSGALVEPPPISDEIESETVPFERLVLEPLAGTPVNLRLTPKIVDAVEAARNTTAFKKDLQIAIDLLRNGLIDKRVAQDAMEPVVVEFGRQMASLPEDLSALGVRVVFGFVGVVAGLVAGIALQSIPVGWKVALTLPGMVSMAPPAWRAIQWHKKEGEYSEGIRQTCAFRRNRIKVPQEVAKLRSLKGRL